METLGFNFLNFYEESYAYSVCSLIAAIFLR